MNVFDILIFVCGFFAALETTNSQGDTGVLLTLQHMHNLATLSGEPSRNNTNIHTIQLGTPDTFFRSCDVDYRRKRVFVFDGNSNSIIAGISFNTTFNNPNQTFKYIHYGVSRDYTRIAYDWLADNLYWTDPVHKTIGVMAVKNDNSNNDVYKIIVDDHISMPNGIAVDPVDRLLFWVDRTTPKIEKSDLSGGSRVHVVTRALFWPSAIAADVTEQRIYWTDYERDTIESVTYTGQDRRFIRRLISSQLYDIAIYKNLILTTDVEHRMLWYVNKDPTIPASNIHFNPPVPIYGVSVYHPDTQPVGQNSCDNTTCSDICVNDDKSTVGYTCLCREGFKLDSDGKSCIEDNSKLHRSILLSNATAICSMDIRALSVDVYDTDCFYTRSNVTAASDTRNNILFLEFDSARRQIFFATSSEINMLSMDEAQSEPDNLFAAFGTISGLSYDWIDHILYVSVSSNNGYGGEILAVSVDTMLTITEKSNMDDPFSVLVVPLKRKLFWLSKASNFAIKSAEIGVDRVTTIFAGGLTNPKDLANDLVRERLFWYDSKKIKSCKYDGTDIQTFTSTLNDGYLLTVYKDYLVWLIETANDVTVMSAEHIIQPVQIHQKFFSTTLGVLSDFKVMDEILQPQQKGPCDVVNSPCQQICLSTNEGAVCQCEFGYQTSDNGRTCASEFVQDNFILLSDWTHNRMYQIDVATEEVHAVATFLAEEATSIGYNPITHKILWSSNKREEIIEVSLDGSEETVLGTVGQAFVEKIVVDETSGNIYYAAIHVKSLLWPGYSYIGVMSPEGLHTKIIELLYFPGGLAIDPADGVLFYSEAGAYPGAYQYIGKSWMDGSDKQHLVVDGLNYPTGLAVDYQARRLYWADLGLNTITSTGYYGEDRKTVVHDSQASIVDIHLDSNYIYYIGWNRPHVTRVSKSNYTDSITIAPNAEFGRLEALFIYSNDYVSPTVNTNCQTNNGRGDCSVFCLPSASGKSVCACQEGYTLQPDNKTCDNGVNDCLGVICHNGGRCQDKIDNFTCQCAAGFSGKFCEIDIDECAGISCANGGSCIDKVNGFECQCKSGYTGTYCETDIGGECYGVTCYNGGSCVGEVNAFRCHCAPGFTGTLCETNINECIGVTCEHGGLCRDGINSYTCQCVAGYTGQYCEVDINECFAITCNHGGSCRDGINSYTCQCVAGYTGQHCEDNINECTGITCEHGGSCRDGINSYTCQCAAGYTGQHCEVDINECTSVMCENGGSCRDGINSYTCQCRIGYTGQRCEVDINECIGVTCEHDGSCFNGINSYTCQCVAGYTGQHCEVDIDDCAGINCANYGSCIDKVNGFECQCKAGYTGTYCETEINECAGITCAYGGVCMDRVDGFECLCKAGYTGTYCETEIDDCAGIHCANGGTCTDKVNGFECQCKAGYTGAYCETDINECIGVICEHGGSCRDGINSYSCQCIVGYTGRHCEVDIDDCVGSVCQHGATCQDGINRYTCQCALGYGGQYCEEDTNDCKDVTCQHGGTCQDGLNQYTCLCVKGYSGEHCEESITTGNTNNTGQLGGAAAAAASDENSIAPVVGGSIAALVLLAIAAVILVVFWRRRNAGPRHERLVGRTDSIKENDTPVSKTTDPEKPKSRGRKGSFTDLRSDRGIVKSEKHSKSMKPVVDSTRAGRLTADNAIAYLGMTNPVYDMYGNDETSSIYAPSVISYASPYYSVSYVPSRSGSRPPSIALSDTYASIHSSQMDFDSEIDEKRRKRSSPKRKM